jgi:DNA invertase Pin-like site-specific DNA recombinase
MKALIYIRYSTPKQEHGASYERQLEDCQELCKRKGWEVIGKPIEDLGRSAWKGHHLTKGELGKLTQRIVDGEFADGQTVLVVEKLDRLSRLKARLSQRWIEDACTAGLSIATVEGGFYTNETLQANILGVLEILMKGQLAFEESQKKSERVRDGHAKSKAKAFAGTGAIKWRLPGWVTLDEATGKPIEIPERGDIVRLICQMSAEGHGTRSIAKHLNESGYQSWGHFYRQKPGWEPTSITRMILSPSIEGDYLPAGVSEDKRVIGFYPKVVDADLAARARAGLKTRVETGGPAKQRANLFTGVMKCSVCGGRMVLQPNQTGRTRVDYARCMNAKRGLCSMKSMFNYTKFEKVAVDAVLHLALDDSYFRQDSDVNRIAVQLAEAKKKLEEQQRLAANTRAMVTRFPDDPGFMDDYTKLRNEVVRLETEVNRLAGEHLIAKGQVDPQEHLRRVLDIKDAIYDADEAIRIPARLKVREAMRANVGQVIFNPEDVADAYSGKTITLIILRGVAAIKFDDRGNILQQAFQPLTRLAQGVQSYTLLDGTIVEDDPVRMRQGLTGGDKTLEQQLDSIVRRSQS